MTRTAPLSATPSRPPRPQWRGRSIALTTDGLAPVDVKWADRFIENRRLLLQQQAGRPRRPAPSFSRPGPDRTMNFRYIGEQR